MEKLFFSEGLQKKLEGVVHGMITIVEAPAGYGKTTAIHQILDQEKQADVNWFTASQSMFEGSFEWFLQQVEKMDYHLVQQIRDLGYINRSNAGKVASLMMRIRTQTPIWLVIDNFQYVLGEWQPQLLTALAQRENDGFHMVLISQSFGRLRGTLPSIESKICRITVQDLALSLGDIQEFAQQMELEISRKQLEMIYEKTDGWSVAVALFLEDLKKNEDISQLEDLNDILYNSFFKALSEKEREMLLQVSLFDKLQENWIPKVLTEPGDKADLLKDLLLRIPLIRYHEQSREYFIHEILRKFLVQQLKFLPEETRKKIYHQTGTIYREMGLNKEAIALFYHAGNYEDILTCKLTGLLMEQFDGIPYIEIVRTLLKETTETQQKKYPISILRLCYALYADTAFLEFYNYMKGAKQIIASLNNDQLIGEWTLLYGFHDFPDIDKMREAYERAELLMSEPSQVFTFEEPFLFGSTSMWYLFYTNPGKMMETADRLTQAMAVYNRLTNDHGAGAAELYRGEALSVQGRFEESEIQAYQAGFLSEQGKNASVTYGVALLFGINAIYQSDMAALQKAIEYLENKARGYSFLRGKAINTYMVETVRGYLLGLMMETGKSAVWTQGEADSLTDLTFTNYMVKTCRITDLILKKEYRRAIGSVEASLTLDERLISVPTKNFMYTGLALCYLATGRLIRASEYLSRALDLASQDKNYTFIACFRRYFSVLFFLPQISSVYGDTIREIKELKLSYTRAEESRIFSMLENQEQSTVVLTAREQEIAELASKGMRNMEIAEALFISENTVKHHLKIIFQKLDIDRRSQLLELLK